MICGKSRVSTYTTSTRNAQTDGIVSSMRQNVVVENLLAFLFLDGLIAHATNNDPSQQIV